MYIVGALFGVGPFAGDPSGSAVRNIGLLVIAIFGIPFLIWRSVVSQRQVDVLEQGHITDRINAAVSGLGSDKIIKRQRVRESGKKAFESKEAGQPDFSKPIFEEISAPNIEVRVGAIYALERIAQDSERDHIRIMEILATYIRNNTYIEKIEIEKRKLEKKI